MEDGIIGETCIISIALIIVHACLMLIKGCLDVTGLHYFWLSRNTTTATKMLLG